MTPLQIEQPHIDLRKAFDTIPGNNVLLMADAPKFTIVAVTDSYLKATNRTREQLIGLGLFEAFPNNPTDPNAVSEKTVRASIEYALTHKEIHYLPVQQYDIPLENGMFEEKHWSSKNQPVLNEDGEVVYILHHVEDVTHLVKARERDINIKSIEKAYSLFMQAPVIIGIVKGDDYVIELANENILQLWGKDETVIGKPLLEAIPEIKDQGFIQLLDNVRNTGEAFYAYERPSVLVRNGKAETRYLDFVYQPFYESENEKKATGVFAVAHDVTEQVLARKKAEESEHRFKDLIAEADVATAVYIGKQMTIQYANDAMVKLWGKDTSVIGKTVREALPELEGQPFHQLLDRVYTTGETYWGKEDKAELVVDGKLQTFYFKFSYKALRNANGEIYGILNMAVDITEQVQTKKNVQQSEQRVRALVESAPFPIGVYIGKEMIIELANQSIIEVWGKGQDVIGKPYKQILPELDNQEIFDQLNSVYTTGIPFHARNQRVDLMVEGRMKSYYFNYSFTPLYDADGNVYGVMNTGADVTDLNEAKQQVEQNEKNIRNMVLQAPVAMCIMLGANHVVDVANEAMIELWGKRKEDVMNKPVFEGLPDAREQGLEELLKNVYQTGETFNAFEHPVQLFRNGKFETVYQNFVYQPYRDSAGNILGVLAISIDVTGQVLARQKIEDIVVQRTEELAKTNEALTRSNEELKRSNTNLEEFAYAASHDMKEPIRKIHFFADRLKNELGDKLNETQKRLFERLEHASQRMGNLIDDLLTYSQATKGVSGLEVIDLNKKVQLVLDDLELEVHQKNAVIKIDALPVITGHSRQLQQLFQNLITNALKYSKPGINPQVHISYQKVKGLEFKNELPIEDANKEYHLIQVSDNGIGFNQQDADRIFNVFTRLHGNAEYKGSGVGLSIAQKVVQNHGGFIWAEGNPDVGAVFKILLPV